jgi:hypothetical protein
MMYYGDAGSAERITFPSDRPTVTRPPFWSFPKRMERRVEADEPLNSAPPSPVRAT